jgi:hypothetical protein
MPQGKAYESLQAARERFTEFRAEQIKEGMTGMPYDPASGLSHEQWVECIRADTYDREQAEIHRVLEKAKTEGEDALTDLDLLILHANDPRAALRRRISTLGI